jgi:hypothetical protein
MAYHIILVFLIVYVFCVVYTLYIIFDNFSHLSGHKDKIYHEVLDCNLDTICKEQIFGYW